MGCTTFRDPATPVGGLAFAPSERVLESLLTGGKGLFFYGDDSSIEGLHEADVYGLPAVLLRRLRHWAVSHHLRDMNRTIRIHASAPPKPAWGAACNGCGVCCLAEPCPVGMLVSLRRRGACRALRWDPAAARYCCGLMKVPALKAVVKRWIAAGQGCDSDAVVT